MAKPVIIDDGGSIRIRELEDDVKMDGLIGSAAVLGGPIGFSSVSSQQFFGVGNNRCLLMVTSVADDGTLTQVPFNSVTGKYGQALAAGDIIVVTTTDATPQTVTITFVNGFLNVALSASASALERKRRRRYVMAVDIIQNVSLNGATVFDAGTTSPASTVVYFLDQVPHTAQAKHKAQL